MCACVRHFVLRARTIARVVCGVQSSKKNGNTLIFFICSVIILASIELNHPFCSLFVQDTVATVPALDVVPCPDLV